MTRACMLDGIVKSAGELGFLLGSLSKEAVKMPKGPAALWPAWNKPKLNIAAPKPSPKPTPKKPTPKKPTPKKPTAKKPTTKKRSPGGGGARGAEGKGFPYLPVAGGLAAGGALGLGTAALMRNRD